MTAPDLTDRVALVTGARRGLGREYALELARLGATVVVNGTPDSPGLEDVVAEIEALGGAAVASRRDISTREGGQGAVDDALDRFGCVDVLVNNAGILRPGMFEDLDDANVEATLAVHLKSLFHVTQPALAAMRDSGYGRIVNTSSNTAFGMAGLASYAAAKAGVVGFTRSLAMECAGGDIRVNAVMPNATTPAMANDPIPGFEQDERFLQAFAGVSHRYGTDLVSPLVGFLASEACTITGETFSALGGRYARVVWGVTDGWLSPPDAPVTPADVAAHVDEIMDASSLMLPSCIQDEYVAMAERLATTTAGPAPA
ncbi:MAG: SDR family NAD(P)-dependent oxidoreductase [Solirubrobacteraceae bacterium]|nr:SDR family NAD(P)-dependent oxidoreductase [Solirubrobacteraceae bacterium]